MNSRVVLANAIAGLFLIVACTHRMTQVESASSDLRFPAAQVAEQKNSSEQLPIVLNKKLENFNLAAADIKRYNIPLQVQNNLAHYFAFLGIDPKVGASNDGQGGPATTPTPTPTARDSRLRDRNVDPIGVVANDNGSIDGHGILLRLLSSSTQFLNCPDFEDWDCIESQPLMQPLAKFRQDSLPNLGSKVLAGDSLKMTTFFTKQYVLPPSQRNSQKFLAVNLAEIINRDWNSISMALFGMDDLDNTMAPVFQAITGSKKKGTDIKAVFDIIGTEKVKDSPILFSYRGNVTQDLNLFSVIDTDENGKKLPSPRTVGQFQYKETPRMITILNEGIQTEQETKAHIEWPPTPRIMHNKFIIFKNKNTEAVWTGTANVAKTCMGDESNANMAVYIEDHAIAKAFTDEFNEMFQFSAVDVTGKFKGVPGSQGIPMGLFHLNKRPNTQRYFSYQDGTEVRVHFSPTDDGEHRSILPALLSARRGDEIRISMFGSGGIELIRAIQFAVEKGAHVRIVFDNLTNSGKFSWIFNSFANIQNNSVFSQSPKGSLQYRMSQWCGLDHHKAASLTRALSNGGKRAEVLIVGSQNWTSPGNDSNDENMLTIRNRIKGLPAAQDFNDHFDQILWPASRPPDVPATALGCKIEDDGELGSNGAGN